MISDDFLRLLRCPLNRRPLKLADPQLLARLNQSIEQDRIVNRLGERVTQPMDGGLVNEPDGLLYAIRDEIPCLLVDEAIDLKQLG